MQASGHNASDIRIGQVRLQIADLERSLAFYQNVLGFQVLNRSHTQAQLGTPDGIVQLKPHEKPGIRFALLDLILPNQASRKATQASLEQAGFMIALEDNRAIRGALWCASSARNKTSKL